VKLVILSLIGCGFVQGQVPQGEFLGTVQAGATVLRVALHLSMSADGVLTGTVDSLDQGVTGMPARELRLADGVLRFGTGPAVYEGTVNPSATEINGQLTQSGVSMPCVFRKVDKIESPRRPQQPQPPFPYNSEEVAVENQGIRLVGTLTWPKGEGPFPAAVLLNGSGPQDRDYTLFGHKPFLLMADYLTRRGFAVLRMDDRGVGKSTGNLAQSTLEDLASDAVVFVEALRARKEIDPKRIGLIGHSEGASVAPMAAVKAGAAFVILLAGTGVSGAELLYEQGQAVLKAANAAPNVLERQSRVQHLLIGEVLAERDPAKLEERLRAGIAKFKSEITPEELALTPGFDRQMEGEMRRLLAPALQSFIRHDPRPYLNALRCPVLVLNGTLDTQVPYRQNLPAIVAALSEGGNEAFTIQSLPRLNHLLQTARTGAVSEYLQIEETMAPVALETIGRWLGGLAP
jgi:uncharacterized protein